MRRTPLSTQILAFNSLLITATVLAASVAATLEIDAQRRQFLVLVAALLATVLVNAFVLRRRFAGLEHLVASMERVDLTRAEQTVALPQPDSDEVARLREAFERMLARLQEERAAAASAILRAQEAERARLARDLHDDVNQALTGVLLRLQATAQDAPPELAGELRETQAVAARAMEELRALAHELRPVALDDLGLSAALRTLAEDFERRSGIETSLMLFCDPDRLAADEQLVVYRVVQESLSNVARHAGAAHVTVEVAEAAIHVVDDGCGFDTAAGGGVGLAGMRERALQVDGRLEVRSRPGGGTTVELVLCAS